MPKKVDLEALDLGHLGTFVGFAYADAVERELKARGFTGLRYSHGFLFQHLVDGEKTVGELARRMKVTQQAVSRVVEELRKLRYVERAVHPDDSRARVIRLSPRGEAAVACSRRTRIQLERKLCSRLSEAEVTRARRTLARALESLGGAEAVRRRRVLPPA